MTSGSTTRRLVGLLAAVLAVSSLLVAIPASVGPAPAASAASASDWNAGNIISDAVFYNAQTMDAGQVQTFLNGKVSRCATGSTCLKDYRQNTDNRPSDRYCDGYTGRANESAAEIIDRVARSCGVNQQVLLVLLQKEQGLITSTAPSARMYAAAMGQGCPDTAPCDSATAGFFYQVYYAARQYEIYRLNPTSFGYQAGRWNNILYHPDASRNCGSARVYIENQATAGLYIYTPYVPNTAALSNLYGTGDSCSSYGNRNFWRLFTDWFGSTRAGGNPLANLEIAESLPGEIRLAGWALDPDTADPIQVHTYVGGRGTPAVADGDRPDVGAAYPAAGSRHGFDVRVPVTTSGAVDVCVHAINVGPGANRLVGCRTVTGYTGAPVGAIDAVTSASGSVELRGWALDPDTAQPIEVHAYVDGVGVPLIADRARTDLAAHYPAHGVRHGFADTLTVPVDARTLCLYAINVGAGANTPLGCRSVMTPSPTDAGRAPLGRLDSFTVTGTAATIEGWALDPDTAAAARIHVYVGAVGREYIADRPRGDIAEAYPPYGAVHGFNEQIDLPPGTSRVCVYAIDTARGANTTLGCQDATAVDQNRPPFGNFEAARVSGGFVTASGWAIDPDTSRAINVKVTVNGSTTMARAEGNRPDVGAAHPGYGAAHGFSARSAVPPGPSTVCVAAVNTSGPDTALGCKNVTTPDEGRAPIGNVDDVSVVGTTATVEGWAIDPDTAQPIDVHIWLGGTATAVRASATRGDVGAAYPLYGAGHGFSAKVDIPTGSTSLCVYAINTSGANVLLSGCRSVTGRTGAPFGSLDTVSTAAGSITATGWTIDPDTVAPTQIHVTVDGVLTQSAANQQRPDVGAAFPAYGSAHGFSLSVPAASGNREVCAWAIDDAGRQNTLLGCRTATVP